MTTRIMVVEDDDLIRQLLSYQLSGAGYEVICVKSGLQALERLLLDMPDLMLLDVMMPELSGWETCRQIRACSNIPIIMLTAKGSDDDVIEGLTLGADDYVTKPFTLPLLLARVEAVLRRRAPAPTERATARPSRPNRVERSTARPEAVVDPHLHYMTEVYTSRPPVASTTTATAQPDPLPEPPASVPTATAAPVEAIPMKRVGQQLYDLRVAREETLEQAAQRSGVRWDFLQALECEHWTYIPRPELRKALRSYCTYLGLDMETILGPRSPHPVQTLLQQRPPLPFIVLAFCAMALVVIGLAML